MMGDCTSPTHAQHALCHSGNSPVIHIVRSAQFSCIDVASPASIQGNAKSPCVHKHRTPQPDNSLSNGKSSLGLPKAEAVCETARDSGWNKGPSSGHRRKSIPPLVPLPARCAKVKYKFENPGCRTSIVFASSNATTMNAH